MARDLIFGRTRRNWARGRACSPVSDEVNFRLTPEEMQFLAELASTQLMAESGDAQSRKKMASFNKKIKDLRARARRGDAKAKRFVQVLEESGALRPVQTMSLGALFVQKYIPNERYRTAVYRQAVKSARMSGRPGPTTKDFFRAKKAVDGIMSTTGIAVYVPRSRPGRITR